MSTASETHGEDGLLRIARAVADDREAAEIFDLVAAEAAVRAGASGGLVVRFADGRAHVVGSSTVVGGEGPGGPWSLAGNGAAARVHRTGRAAHVADYSDADDQKAAWAAAHGFVSSLGVPIRLGGGLWGAVTALYRADDAPTTDAGGDLERLGELVQLALDWATRRAERGELSQALAHLEGRYRSIVENAVDAIVTTSEDNRILAFNQAAERIFGHAAADVVGRDLGILLDARPAEMLSEGPRRHPERGEPGVLGAGREVRATHADGTEFPVHLTITEVRHEGTRTFTAIIRDLTEIARTQEELRRSNEELERLADIASHDLRAPLRGAKGLLDLLIEELGDPAALPGEVSELVDEITSTLDRMDALIAGLMAYSRLRAPGDPASAVDLGETVERVLAELDAAIVEARAEIEVGELPPVPGQPERLAQLVRNLVANAVRYGAPEGEAPRIAITSTAGDGGVILCVSDRGPGIPEGERTRVFGLFERLHALERSGAGIGLALCARIAEQHGGSIEVVDAPGGGALFKVFLPSRGATGAPVELSS